MTLNTPKKPRESRVLNFVNLAGTAGMLNIAFLLFCLPVVTIGPAFSGLYSGVRYMIRGDGALQGFWEGFKKNFVRMMLSGVVFTGIFVYFFLVELANYEAFLISGDPMAMILHGIPAVMAVMVFMALIPLNIYIPYTPMDWLRNGINLIIKAPHWVLLSAVLLCVPAALFIGAVDVFWMICVVFFGFWFAITSFVSTLFLKDALIDLLLKYKEEHPEEYEEDDEEDEEEEEDDEE